jgi:hypothetical protein
MLKEIDVRFFVVTDFDTDEATEITHQEFVERYAASPGSRVDIEKHSVFANGVRQLCITLNEETAQ